MKPGAIEFDARCVAGRRVVLTDHACQRARERFHWTSQTLLRMAHRALQCGVAPGDTGGLLNYFLHSRAPTDDAACPFLYGENIYVFATGLNNAPVVLMTIYRAPQQLLRSLVNRPVHHTTADTYGSN